MSAKVTIGFELPEASMERKQALLNRMVGVFQSFHGRVPKALLDALDDLAQCGLDADAECDQLEAILDRWARLH